jgi:fibronectin-binding autotransporter adhesin
MRPAHEGQSVITHQPNKDMLRPINNGFSKTIASLLVSAAFAVAPLAVHAVTTNTFTFNNTTAGIGAGPVNPANGVVSISGATLTAGDMVVFDGIVIDVPGSTADAWGAVELNAGGYLGLTGASLGVLMETGTASGNDCQLFLNGNGTSTHFGSDASDARTNRVRIELACTATGSTANMDYLVEIDQGVTGTFNASLSGTGVDFANNTITLTFGANNQSHRFIQNQPVMAVAAPTPSTLNIAPGVTATFTANITAGYPLVTAQQWLSNGVPIPNATNLTYATPPVTTAYNGAQYSISVTNELNPANWVTTAASVLYVRSGSGLVTFDFPTTTVAAGWGAVTDPGVAISGGQLLAGDTVVFDGIVIPNGDQASDAWTAINIAGAGYGNATSAQLGVLCRLGSGPSQLFINGGGASNPTSGGAPTNRVRIELYPSANGSTTNMGWLVKIDQNLSGTFQAPVTGTNLTFANNTLPLTFGSSGSSSFVIQDPQSPVSIFSGPDPAYQTVSVGSPATVGVTVEGWAPAFQWRKNGATILNATNQTYTLAAATLADNGDQFTVIVSNRLNSLNVVTSAVARVSVLIPNNYVWYPIIDATTWDTVTANWTTNGGTSQTTFSSGNNVTFDSLGYNLGGNNVTVTNSVSANGVTVNAILGAAYTLTGAGSVGGQSLFLTGDGSGTLGLQALASFTSATIDAGSTLNVGYSGINGSLQANTITNNGVIDFFNAAGTLVVAARFAGSGTVSQYGSATTVLSATNGVYSIGVVNAGSLAIACAPTGAIVNNSELQPNSTVDFLMPNSMSGSGLYHFTGFQTTTLTGVSEHTGRNWIQWGKVVVDNPQALGDITGTGSTFCGGADNVGGLYLSNNITWVQALALDPRQGPPSSAATAPHLANLSGTNAVTSPLTFEIGQGGSEINVDAIAGQLTVDSVLANNAPNANTLNLQGAAIGIWNGALSDGVTAGVDVLSVLKRGAGTWKLGGANTYSGLTTVANGTLLIDGEIGAGGVSVEAGATLGGGGVIGGAVTVAAGGTLSPGASIGTLTISGNLTLNASSTNTFEVNGSTPTNDVVVAGASVTYGGMLNIVPTGTFTVGQTFALFSGAGATSASNFASITGSPGSGKAFSFTNGVLSVVSAAYPQPVIGPVTVSGTNLVVSVPTVSGVNYVLQSATNLTPTINWKNETTNAGTGGNLILDVPIEPGKPQKFLRFRVY